MLSLVKKIFGTANERTLKKIRPVVGGVAELESEYQALSPEALRAKTDEFKKRLADGETLDDVLPHAFAAVREASRRTTGMRHFDVQLIGAMVLHHGKIAEMKTGEGKTLVATAALYLNALEGKGAHLVTVNDYLARRDVQWMGPIFHALGVSVASIIHEASFLYDPHHIVKDYRYQSLRPISRRDAYLADITYGTNNEFGFDYLRDNMKFSLEEYSQRELNFAIVDEVDNILIDEARTPLIISGPAEESTDKYYKLDRVIPKLRKEVDYTIDEKLRQVMLTDEGVAKVERILGIPNLYDPTEIDTLHHATQALRAHSLYKKDVDYVVKDGQVIIVDEFTGRLMPGRRWSDGLHQAVEAKEAVTIERENQTLATITIQNYFRMYKKLAGMTGTADTEAVEFKSTYKLDVVVIPPNRKMIRDDLPDVVYRTEGEKFAAVIEEVKECRERGQPVLVGTVSVEKSERLSKLLKKDGVKHNVLNAVNHELEASVIAQAGRKEAVTIATNMAGRGTDILLGGNPEFLARAEMENEWIQRVSKLASPEGAPVKRYEETLRELRENYDEEVERIRNHYEPQLAALDEKRKEALRSETDSRHKLREESPYRTARERYERYASSDLIPALGDGRAVTDIYQRVKNELEAELDEARGSDLQEIGAEFLAARTALDALLEEWADPAKRVSKANVDGLVRQVLDRARTELGAANGHSAEAFERLLEQWSFANPEKGESKTLADHLNSARVLYDRVLGDLEMQLLLRGGDNGAAAEYQGAVALRHSAEEEHLAVEKPFEKALGEAHSRYETQRQDYVRAIDQIREQLDKAPQEFQGRFEEILAKYKQTCAEEHEQVVAAGGLHIVGTERHESRRIDNQLRGRAGRQGDPGSSRFFLSLEDDLLRIFGADRIQGLMQRLGMEEGVPIEHRLITRAISNAQSKVEAHNFDIRKHLLEYDDVMNKQREVVYTRRRGLLSGEALRDDVLELAEGLAEDTVVTVVDADVAPSEWDWKALEDAIARQFAIRIPFSEEEREHAGVEGIAEKIFEGFKALYEAKEREFTPGVMRQIERIVMLQTLDGLWKDHLLNMDHLKEGIGLRGYGQKNPLQEYQKEGFDLFGAMLSRFESETVTRLATVQVAQQQQAPARPRVPEPPRAPAGNGDETAAADQPSAETVAMMQRLEARRRSAEQQQRQTQMSAGGQTLKSETLKRDADKVGRNDPCPCGSGKKYKKCHGA